jgi:hypothetical protein
MRACHQKAAAVASARSAAAKWTPNEYARIEIHASGAILFWLNL